MASGPQPASASLLAHGLAGASSSVLALALLYPLDQLRTLQQLGMAPKVASPKNARFGERLGCLVDTVEEQGLAGFYRGLTPSLTALAVSNFIFYMTFHALKQIAEALRVARLQRQRAHGGGGGDFAGRRNLEDLLTSSLAGMLNVVIANPLWVGATRMRSAQQDQMRQRKEEDQAASDANASEAHEGDAVAAEVDPSSNNNNDNDNDESSSSSSSGGSGGASSSSGPVRAAEYGGVLGLVRLLLAIGKREGVGKLWSGTAAGLVLVSNPAIHFAVYEGCKRVLMLRKVSAAAATSTKPSALASGPKLGAGAAGSPVMALTPTEGFVLGALAKFTATVATYPLQLAQSRLRSEASSRAAAQTTPAEESAAAEKNNSSDSSGNSHDGSSDSDGTGPASSAVAPVPPPSTTLSCLAAVWRTDGLAGLFNGFETKIVQSVLTSALVFGSYETLLGFMVAPPGGGPSSARAPAPARR